MRKGRENGRRGGKGGGNDNGPAGNNSLGGNVPERREEVSVAATEIAAHYASLPPLSSRFKRVSTRDPLGSWKRRETVISDVVDRENGSTMGCMDVSGPSSNDLQPTTVFVSFSRIGEWRGSFEDSIEGKNQGGMKKDTVTLRFSKRRT